MTTPNLLDRFCYALAIGLLSLAARADAADRETVVVESVVLRLIDEADAPALVSGMVAEIMAHEGSIVRRGETLARLDDAEARLAAAAAEAEVDLARHAAADDVPLRQATKTAEAARAELGRSEESIARFPRSVSRSQLDVERLAIDQAELEREAARQATGRARLETRRAEARHAIARALVERRRIVAPLSGVVVEANVRQGEWLEPGQRAFRILDTKRLKAEGFVGAEAAARLAAGDPVTLERAPGASQPASPSGVAAASPVGRVAFVSPEIDPVTGQVRVVAHVDNAAGRLRPGERVRMLVRTAHRKAAEPTDEPTDGATDRPRPPAAPGSADPNSVPGGEPTEGSP